MKNAKSMISFFLTLVLLTGVFTPAASAAGSEGQFSVSDASGAPGEEIEIKIRIEENPGIIAAALEIGYDAQKLELLSVTDCKLLNEPTFSKTQTQNPYIVSWNDALASSNTTKTGDLVILTFQILPDCDPSKTEITIDFDPENVFDWDLNNVSFTVKNGTVTVKGQEGTSEELHNKISYDSFTDLAPESWYRESVEYMLEKGLMNGMSEDTFDPNGLSTRAQFVTILYRAAGSPEVKGITNPFTDVKRDSWYEDSVLWGYSHNVVKGVSSDSFAPGESITREQIVTLLYRYDGAAPLAKDYLQGYTDASSVSAYAVEAMNWAVGNNIVKGVTETILSPDTTATRVQIAAMVSRYLKAKEAIPVPTPPVVSQ